ncbi:Variant SH3 domain containing protein, partial [Trichostrongylus colubriformis]
MITVTRPKFRLVPPRLARVKSETGFGTRSEPDLRPPTLEDDCRWFVALFDYSHHMSPNANAETDELSFRKHQLIKVYGEVDADGFYHGQIGNRVGLVPSNMVIEIAKDDLLPRRTRTDAVPSGAEPTLRRMRWGSLKSRSYDHAGDRRSHDRAPTTSHFASSLDRREMERREVSATRGERYRRSNGRDYEYRRDYDDRYREVREPREHREMRDPRDMRDPRAMRDDYHRDYRDEDEYPADKYRDRGYERDRERERDYERRDDRRDERREAERRELERREVERREVERRDYERRHEYPREEPYRRERREEGYREDRHYDPYAQRYDPSSAGPSSGIPQSMATPQQPPPGPSHGGPPQMAQLAHQMGQMQMVTSAMQQPAAAQQMPQVLPGLSTGMQPGMLDTGINGVPTKKMVAKFDYDSRQLSPNVDAEQVELSFRQGDIITVYGEMDDDGFYMGELNGLRGLVPSNFLQASLVKR